MHRVSRIELWRRKLVEPFWNEAAISESVIDE